MRRRLALVMKSNWETTTPAGLHLADRVRDITQTDLRRLSARCAEIGGINLSQGVCDLPAPDEVKSAACRAIQDDRAIYTNLAGIAELRRAIAAKTRDFNGFEVDPDREVAVTVGSTGAFGCVAMATLNPGDEVIVFSPFYIYYLDTLRLLGAIPRFVQTHPPDWRYSDAELAAAFTPRTRMVLVNTPVNPTGKVFTERELARIAELARTHDTWIVTDEIYEYITFEREHVSIAKLPDAQGRTMTLSGPSKTYAVTGWRIGYVTGPARVIEKVLVVNDLFYICAPAPMQHGVLAGMGFSEAYYERLGGEYQAKRDMLADTLRSIGFEPYVPQGAFYLMADFGPGRYANSLAAAETILEDVGVATVPGAPFYATPAQGDTQLRFCFAKKAADLEEACRRLKRLKS
jgi:aminotransferase